MNRDLVREPNRRGFAFQGQHKGGVIRRANQDARTVLRKRGRVDGVAVLEPIDFALDLKRLANHFGSFEGWLARLVSRARPCGKGELYGVIGKPLLKCDARQR